MSKTSLSKKEKPIMTSADVGWNYLHLYKDFVNIYEYIK